MGLVVVLFMFFGLSVCGCSVGKISELICFMELIDVVDSLIILDFLCVVWVIEINGNGLCI